MAEFNFKTMIMMVVSLIFISFLLPIGLVYIGRIGDINVLVGGVNYTLSDVGMDTVITLLTTIVPLAIAIGIILYYIRIATK